MKSGANHNPCLGLAFSGYSQPLPLISWCDTGNELPTSSGSAGPAFTLLILRPPLFECFHTKNAPHAVVRGMWRSIAIMPRVKQIILIRKDLNMRRGKEIAQGSHASMAFIVERVRRRLEAGAEVMVNLSSVERNWLAAGMAKVCLRVNSEHELLARHERATQRGLQSHLIRDSGRTEFSGRPTLTACAIGPDEVEKIDGVTGDLEPY